MDSMDAQPDTVKTPRVAQPSELVAQAPTTPTLPRLTPPTDAPSERQGSLWERARAWAAAHPRTVAKTGALLVYLLISLAYFWWPIRGHFLDRAISASSEATLPDLGQALWYLRWWPYALTHHLNPFITNEIWHAYGYNTAWQVSIPGLALLAWPITATLGVIAAYNTIVILAFTLTAWAMFLLCYHLTHQLWPSLVGGYLFGYCAYMLAQGTGHPHLIVLFPYPLTVYLAILRYERRISRAWFLGLTGVTLAFLFLVTLEEYAFLTLFAYLALAVWCLLHWREWREAVRVGIEAAGAYVISLIIASPVVYYLIADYTSGSVHTTRFYAGDLLGYFLPTSIIWTLSKYFVTVPLSGVNLAEKDSYMGLPLVALMFAYWYERWKKPDAKFFAAIALVGFALSLGPTLMIANFPTMHLAPIDLAYRLPIIQKGLPVRMALFVEFVGAVMAALWLAWHVRRQVFKVALGLLLVVVILPNIPGGYWNTDPGIPQFFSANLYQRYIKPGANILIVPLGSFSREAMWQQATDFAFTEPTGYGTVAPHPEDILPVTRRFTITSGIPTIRQPASAAEANAFQYYVAQYLATEHITGIVVREDFETQFSAYLSFLREPPIHAGGVYYYPVPSQILQTPPPAEQVKGEPIARVYQLGVAGAWDNLNQRLVATPGATGVVAQTWEDSFASGKYALTLTIQNGLNSASATPLGHAEVIVNGRATFIPLSYGTTSASFSVPDKTGVVDILIVSDGGGFTVGNTTLAKV